jgi:hypothetical protein
MRAVGGHDIAGVTDHEQFAGFLLGQQFRHHTAIATILPEPIATEDRVLRKIPLLGAVAAE